MNAKTLALVVLLSPLAGAQTLLHTFKPEQEVNGDPLDYRLGVQLAAIGDLDHDGVGDLAIWSEGYQPSGTVMAYPDRVRVQSAVSGGKLWAVESWDGEDFGFALAALGDVDGDGVDDLAVGAPAALSYAGRVYVLSGVDGSTLQVWEAGALHGHFGYSLAALDDLDGDGLPELAVGARYASGAIQNAGAVGVLSGASGSVIYSVEGLAQVEQYGAALAALGDVDLDGVGDFAVAAPAADGPHNDAGRIEIRSGADGALLLTFKGGAPNTRTGSHLSRLGDVDGDGAADVLAYLFGSTAGAISGRTGTLLYSVPGPAYYDGGLAGLGDVDGDGVGDFAVRSSFTSSPLVLHSGVDGSVLSNVAWGSFYGGSVAAAGDVDLDGRGDLLVSRVTSGSGEVRLYSGVTNPPPGTILCSGDGSTKPCPCQGPPVYREDFDTGVLPPGWTATGIWHITSACAGCSGSDPYAYFGYDFTCDYFGAPVHHSLVSPWIQLPATVQGTLALEFCHSILMDQEGNRAWVYVHGEDGTTLAYYSGTSSIPYDPQPYDITQYVGQKVQIEWYFYNDWIGYSGGWRVDDVSISWLPNDAQAGQGCRNSTGLGGQLRAVGSTSVAADDVLLSVTQLAKQTTGIFFVGDGQLQPPLSLHAGLVCTGGTTTRYPSAPTGPFGALSLTSPVALSQGLVQAGSSYAFQAWYRDPHPLAPCGAPSNLSNGVLVTFTP